MIVLDSDVLSALMKPQVDRAIFNWLNRYPNRSLVTTSVTVFEVRSGLRLLPEGKRRADLEAALDSSLQTMLRGRVLHLDETSAVMASRLFADRKKRGVNVGIGDTLIAGIVLANGASIATGNVKDFHDIDALVINPWDHPL